MAKTEVGKKLRKKRLARRRERLGSRWDPAYLRFVGSHRCCVPGCNNGSAIPHHQPPKSHTDWSDHKTIDLCDHHHTNRYSGSIHTLGVEEFQRRTGVIVAVRIEELNEEWTQQQRRRPRFVPSVPLNGNEAHYLGGE